MYSDEWHVCFTNADNKHWIQRLLKPGFTHVYAFKISPAGKLITCVDSTISYLDATTLINDDVNLSELMKCHKILRVKVNPVKRDRSGLCWFNCVEVTKAILGIKSFFTFTPYQLYKELLKWEQVEALPDEQNEQQQNQQQHNEKLLQLSVSRMKPL